MIAAYEITNNSEKAMLDDVLKWAAGQGPAKRPSKETLNHPALIEFVSGLNAFMDTIEAYRRTYEALGIDIINRIPLENAPAATPPGQKRKDPARPYEYVHLGVYDTALRTRYMCGDPDEVWDLDVEGIAYEDLVVPVPHPCRKDDIADRQNALGHAGLYYPMLYTTLFMWPVETLGWEVFMTAAALEPERFGRHFIAPCVNKSIKIIGEMLAGDHNPFVFLHDDLADANGPVFAPDWYENYIFPHYPEIFAPAKKAGRKIILVADGNMTAFLPRLVELGVDGLMFETPATPLEAVIEHFGSPGRFFIGGIETGTMTFVEPRQVREMTLACGEKCMPCPGFAMASSGGLHGNIPMANLEAYFDARAELGITPRDWRQCCHI